MLIAKIVEPEKDPVQWRGILAKLEVLLKLMDTISLESNKWKWQQVFEPLVIPGLMHANPDVRHLAIDIARRLIKYDSNAAKVLEAQDGVKPNIINLILEKGATATPAKASPVRSSPAKSSPAKSSPAKSSPSKLSPVKSSPNAKKSKLLPKPADTHQLTIDSSEFESNT